MTDREALQQRIRALFLGELDDAVRLLTEQLLRLEATATTDAGPALVREMFRVAHGVKGAAHAASALEAAHAAHVLEDGLAAVRDGSVRVDAELVARMLEQVDALARSRDVLDGGAGPVAPRPAATPAAADPAPPPEHAEAAPAPGPAPVPAAAAAPAPAPGPTAPPASPAAPAPAMVRVSAAKLEALLERTSDLAAVVGQVATQVRALAPAASGDGAGAAHRRAQEATRLLTRLGADVANAAVGLTFQTFADVAQGLDRVVHDLAVGAGRRVRLVLAGGDVEVDRAVGAALREPLLHLLRNAVDHGIEDPAERLRAGKAETGRITVTAALRDGRLQVEVADDGRGLDRDALHRVAARHGLVDVAPEEAVFAAGLSTASTVSDVSGRGVGLDAIRARLHGMGGTVRLRSEAGAGTVVTMLSPVTLAVAQVLAVRAAGQLLCIPLTAVDRLVRCGPDDVRDVDGVPTVVVGGAAVPVVALAAALDLADDPRLAPGPLRLVVVDAGGGAVGLAVDELVGESDVVVRGRPPRLAGLEAVLGTAALADGRSALVVNVADCVRAGLADVRRGWQVADEGPAPARRPLVLVADDTVTTRTLEAGILEAAGYRVAVAADGAEAWDMLQLAGADLVLSDVDMPRVDGIELCRMIRDSERFADLPVVLLTSLGSDRDRQRGLDAGASAYIVKSEFDRDTLLDVIERAL